MKLGYKKNGPAPHEVGTEPYLVSGFRAATRRKQRNSLLSVPSTTYQTSLLVRGTIKSVDAALSLPLREALQTGKPMHCRPLTTWWVALQREPYLTLSKAGLNHPEKGFPDQILLLRVVTPQYVIMYVCMNINLFAYIVSKGP